LIFRHVRNTGLLASITWISLPEVLYLSAHFEQSLQEGIDQLREEPRVPAATPADTWGPPFPASAPGHFSDCQPT
jgi:hypothetical protein